MTDWNFNNFTEKIYLKLFPLMWLWGQFSCQRRANVRRGIWCVRMQRILIHHIFKISLHPPRNLKCCLILANPLNVYLKMETFSALGIFFKKLSSLDLWVLNMESTVSNREFVCRLIVAAEEGSGIQPALNGLTKRRITCHGAFEYLHNSSLKLSDNCLIGFSCLWRLPNSIFLSMQSWAQWISWKSVRFPWEAMHRHNQLRSPADLFLPPAAIQMTQV